MIGSETWAQRDPPKGTPPFQRSAGKTSEEFTSAFKHAFVFVGAIGDLA